MAADELPQDPRVEAILEVLTNEARIDRARLTPQTRVDELGLSPLDLAMTLFEIEDRFDVDLPAVPPGAPQATLAELVQQVLAGIDERTAMVGAA